MRPIPEPLCNLSSNPTLASLLTRRHFLRCGLGAALLPFFAPNALSAAPLRAFPTTPPLSGSPLLRHFPESIPTHSDDRVTLMAGFTLRVILPWGDPLTDPAHLFRPDGSNTAAEQATQIGDNHDGMHFFPLSGRPDEGLLALNHEYTNPEYLYTAEYLTPWTPEKAHKALAAHGVSIVHLKRTAHGWDKLPRSRYHRRITGATPMLLTGPAAGHPLLRTAADPTGRRVLGTLNNCAHGVTPWGTYLTCEENFNLYFGNGDPDHPMHKRYGLGKGERYRWHEVIDRFDLKKEPNEANRFGWVVEIDPFDPTSTPKKRTALGRFKHENAAVTLAKDGRVVVYMGDDEAHEYLYKFISRRPYDPKDPKANRDLLDDGDLYVAQFLPEEAGDGRLRGRWNLVSHRNPKIAADPRFPTQAEVLIYTRAAADLAGATKLDRPEWIAIHPLTGEVYATLTNNPRRTPEQIDPANPRPQNRWGQILRWREAGDDPASLEFTWDLYLLAGNPLQYAAGDLRAGSPNITPANMFNSPDGLAFDAVGRLWIQTDGGYSNEGDYRGQGNNQMLVACPYTGEIRRFLVGPSGCEITGVTWTPDGRTMFVNVQHPGEALKHPRQPRPELKEEERNAWLAQNPTAFSNWPHSQFPHIAGGRPRSATLVIEREDGFPIFAAL
ncbi:MAG: PhoX family phosphatase [Hydrogenophilus sp.]|nr:PhoX family phosphatase [Hydrogenophilus sp.]